MGVRVKPNAKDCRIKEQIIEDLVTGLTLQFAHRDADPERGRKETIKLTIYGDILPYGNRDIIFNAEGVKCAGGTGVSGACRPSWLHEVAKD